jgi:hypothetical protein
VRRIKLAVIGCFAALSGTVAVLFGVEKSAAVSLAVFFLAATVFTCLYMCRSRWRATTAGRALLYVTASIAAITGQITLTLWLGPAYPGRAVVRACVYFVVAAAMLNLLFTLIGEQYRRRVGGR